MQQKIIYKSLLVFLAGSTLSACVTPSRLSDKQVNTSTPQTFLQERDSSNSARIPRSTFFTDPYLNELIDSALHNNQELNIILQEITVAQNEIRARKGEYLPFVGLGAGGGAEKVSRYTSKGASDEITEIAPGKATPKVVPDTYAGAFASWEVDIWHKLRNAKKAAVMHYFATVEGKNFMITHLVAEIADAYYELIALDNQSEIIQKNIGILGNALNVIRQEKAAARVTELAVKRFEAELYKAQSLQYNTQQRIIETENKLNYLCGRYPEKIKRNAALFDDLVPAGLAEGVPGQLLGNRPDIRQAEHMLEAAKLNVKSARANFYPSLRISAGLGLQAFNPAYLGRLPEAMAASLIGELAGPLINRNAIIANYKNASARQVQAIYDYERTLLNAYLEVLNELYNIRNLASSYDMKNKQVDALTRSTDISLKLFTAAKADYMEVLLTQRDVLEARMELIETKMKQMHAMVNTYRALGGGWQ